MFRRMDARGCTVPDNRPYSVSSSSISIELFTLVWATGPRLYHRLITAEGQTEAEKAFIQYINRVTDMIRKSLGKH